ncbi:DVU_1555 family C-GCAxxG-C-C protein [Desulfospira joergensenii]|uniref:DVU_1555 family C-GCAxxG-C-C protein n=1 Tax=Desulfospira joergensenii TaxID=53329 RepID=UPI0003B7B320|nr:DV_1555 family C-GCAxxG-C-C protein [Desulfospira joergensenii]
MIQMEILKLKNQGYCCSQIMVKMLLDLMGRENPDLVDFSRGLCMGSGRAEGPCGIFTAGMGILAMMAKEEKDVLALMQEAWIDFFDTAVPEPGRTACREISGEFYPQPDPRTCGNLLDQSFSSLLALVQENGFDPQDFGEE